ncbi:cell division protein FtsQ/DivIB [Aestuariirhabdus sp. LZHN29]|uniref:cell division protein FtsQ/DivIB n=1 Tax=Aestuariirhabdus sp. LZHN29 TaxID=3417462 RepID=UPI003CEA324C
MLEIRNNKAKKRGPVGATTRGASRSRGIEKPRWGQRTARAARVLLVVSLLAVGVGGTGWLVGPMVAEVVNQPIERVSVKGRLLHMPNQQVQLAMQPYLSERFFTVDLERVQENLLALPWARDVSVRRQWPGIIEVTVTEQVPVARWQKDALLNNRGDSFVVEKANNFLSLPHLFGPDGSEIEVMEQYQTLSNLLRPKGLNVRELTLTDRGSWQLETNDFSIMIGRNHVVDKIQRFVAVYDAALKDNKRAIEKIDVRYLNGVAVAWSDQGESDLLLSETVGRVKL